MSKLSDLGAFLQESINSVGMNSRHFDEILEIEHLCVLSDLESINSAIGVISKLIELLKRDFVVNINYIVVYIPLCESVDPGRWDAKNWSLNRSRDEPPSLYIIKREDIWGYQWEGYQKPINFDISQADDIDIIFRSWRNVDAQKNEWEFSNGIYLIRPLEI